jgi:hypothetical protein
MDALYIVLLAFGAQAAAGALAMTAWLLRIGTMPSPRVEPPIAHSHGSRLPRWASASHLPSLTVLPGLDGTVEVADGRPPAAAYPRRGT